MREQRGSSRLQSKYKKPEKHAINEFITAPEVRLIGLNSEQIGVLKTSEALRMAEEAGVDLVEVAAEANPPVCRLLDYGKLRYREQKKAAEARKRSATQTTKEIRVRYNTDSHDLETKVRNARKFLENGDKVRFQMRFKGREVIYKALGDEIFKQILGMLSDIAVVEDLTPLIGNRMILCVMPASAAAVKA